MKNNYKNPNRWLALFCTLTLCVSGVSITNAQIARDSKLLASDGVLVNIVSTPEIYTHEWVTFSTSDFPDNRNAQCGDVVKIVTTDYSDAHPVEDIFWPHEDYLRLFTDAGLEVVCVERPLASGDEGVAWCSETRVAPWAIYLLKQIKSKDN